MGTPRTILGISFCVHAPSIWQALWPPLYIIYTSEGWVITEASGKPMHVKPFISLIEAIAIIHRSVKP